MSKQATKELESDVGTLKETAKQIAWMLVIGASLMLGIRAVEWLVPEPPSRIIVCMASDLGKRECRNLEELMQAKEKPAPASEGK